MFGMGCFWGAERKFWEADGVITTAVGYAGGFTPNPTYEEVCSARTGHNEVVLVVFDPTRTSYDAMLKIFWENHDPTQGMRQGNDVGTQYRSGIYCFSDEQLEAAKRSRDHVPGGADRERLRDDHDRDRRGRALLLRGAVPPAVPGEEPGRLLRPGRYRVSAARSASRRPTERPEGRRVPIQHADQYHELRTQVLDLVRSQDLADLEIVAPAAPEWRVRDLLAHLSGVCTDIVNGNLDGVTTDAWTAAQVAPRRDWPSTACSTSGTTGHQGGGHHPQHPRPARLEHLPVRRRDARAGHPRRVRDAPGGRDGDPIVALVGTTSAGRQRLDDEGAGRSASSSTADVLRGG